MVYQEKQSKTVEIYRWKLYNYIDLTIYRNCCRICWNWGIVSGRYHALGMDKSLMGLYMIVNFRKYLKMMEER